MVFCLFMTSHDVGQRKKGGGEAAEEDHTRNSEVKVNYKSSLTHNPMLQSE